MFVLLPSFFRRTWLIISDATATFALGVRGKIRSILSKKVFPAQDDNAQREAGKAAAQTAVSTQISHAQRAFASKHNITDDELRTGLENIAGSKAAGGGTNRLNTPHPDIPQEAGVAAFFDVDNTLIKGASILLFARGLAKKRFFTAKEILGFAYMQIKFRVSGKENAQDIASGREQALALIKGRKESDVVELAEEIWAATIAERIFPGTKELADMHLQAGHEVWLVTATPVQLAQIIARELGFTGALGTVAEVKDGCFTGRILGDILHGAGKKHAVVALASYENFDLSRCTAYSDSVNDIPMLQLTGTAVAVNPDPALRHAAEEHGWEIRDYRRSRRMWHSVKKKTNIRSTWKKKQEKRPA